MTFNIEILPEAESEIEKLNPTQQQALKNDFLIVENKGIEFVKIKPIQSKVFEIKTNEIRSLFTYQNNRIVVIGVVFVKKTSKTPKDKIRLAKKRLKEK